MKQVVLNIPDNKYFDFIDYVRNKFTYIRIKEKNKLAVQEEDENSYNMLLSESSLAEDWLTKEDNRWDEVL